MIGLMHISPCAKRLPDHCQTKLKTQGSTHYLRGPSQDKDSGLKVTCAR